MAEYKKRPNIKPGWSILEKMLEVICLIILAANIILIVTEWSGIPKNIPMHFNFFGSPDSIGNKTSLISLLLVCGGLYIILTVLEFFPRFYNFPFEITEKNALYSYGTAREMLVVMKTEIAAIFTYITYADIKTAKGVWDGLGHWFLIVVLAVLAATMIFYIVRLVKHKDGESERLVAK